MTEMKRYEWHNIYNHQNKDDATMIKQKKTPQAPGDGPRQPRKRADAKNRSSTF